MTVRHRINWRSLAIEGMVIVLSILLAFAIDAWWDKHQQQELVREQLQRVAADFLQNQSEVQALIHTHIVKTG